MFYYCTSLLGRGVEPENLLTDRRIDFYVKNPEKLNEQTFLTN